jgi:hypothetical protein
LLLVTLLALRTLLLIALTTLDLLLLLALAALCLLLLNALAAFGPLNVALALTLDLLRPFTLGTLYGAPFCARLAAFCPGLAPLYAGSGTLRGGPRGLAGGTSSSPAATTPALITILRLGQARSAGAEQQYSSRCRNHLPVHLVTLP